MSKWAVRISLLLTLLLSAPPSTQRAGQCLHDRHGHRRNWAVAPGTPLPSNRHTGVSFTQTTDSRGSYRFAKARPAPPQQRSTYCSSRSAAASACRNCRTSRPWAGTQPEFQAVSWFGLVGPAGMPPDVAAKINAEVRGMFADPEFLNTFLDHDPFQFIAGLFYQPDEFHQVRGAEVAEVITDAKIKVE